MKYFCKKCGQTTNYKLQLPDKCGNCNASLNVSPITIIDKSIIKNELNLNKNTKEEIASEMPVTNFKNIKPKFNITIYNSKPQQLGDLFENDAQVTNNQNTDDSFNGIVTENRASEQKTREQIMAEFASEASSSREK